MIRKLLLLIFLFKILTISAVEFDISKGKCLNQSKIIIGLEPKYATDGDLNTYFRVTHISEGTDKSQDIWIEIDLYGIYNIIKVILWTTNDNDVGIIDIREVSQYPNYYLNNLAQNAIDGKESTYSLTKQHQSSLKNIAAWLRIDLGKIYDVIELQIYSDDSSFIENNGFYIVYIDSSSEWTNECFTYDQNVPENNQYYTINCITSLSGRYVTFVKYATNNIDLLSFNEIIVFTKHSALPLLYPKNYSSIYSSTLTPITFVCSTKKASTSVNSNTLPNCDAIINSSKLNQIIIGIVVGFLAFLIGILFGNIIQILLHKKVKNPEENTVAEYELPSPIVNNSHEYEELHKNSNL